MHDRFPNPGPPQEYGPNQQFSTNQYIAKPQKKDYQLDDGQVKLIIYGIIILLIGSIIGASHGFINDPMRADSDDYDNNLDYKEAEKQYREDGEKYKDNTRIVRTFGSIIQFVGLIVFSVGILQAALGTNKLSQNTRLGLLIAMGIIVGLKISGMIMYYYLGY